MENQDKFIFHKADLVLNAMVLNAPGARRFVASGSAHSAGQRHGVCTGETLSTAAR